MPALYLILAVLCAGLWYGWYYLAALGCGFSNGSKCGPFQGNLEMTIVTFWAPMGVIALLFFVLWLAARLLSRRP